MTIKILDLIFGFVAIVGGILSLFKEKYWSTAITLIIAGFLLVYFSAYISQINDNEKNIKRLLEKLKIHKDLINMKGEIEYLKDEQKRLLR
jgi:site-specific recombinase